MAAPYYLELGKPLTRSEVEVAASPADIHIERTPIISYDANEPEREAHHVLIDTPSAPSFALSNENGLHHPRQGDGLVPAALVDVRDPGTPAVEAEKQLVPTSHPLSPPPAPPAPPPQTQPIEREPVAKSIPPPPPSTQQQHAAAIQQSQPEPTTTVPLSTSTPPPLINKPTTKAAPAPSEPVYHPDEHAQSSLDNHPHIAHPESEIPRVNPDVVEPISVEVKEREVEKHAAAKRELHGLEPMGTVVKGMEDDKVWAMLRRFDRQISHVLSPPHGLPAGQPDLRRSPLPTVPYSSDLVMSNVQRLYASGGIGGIRLAREMMRLMSWSEEDRKRTSYFCAAYFTAWIFHQTTPLIIGFLMVLIAYPPSRPFLFPVIPPPSGVPLSATDPTNKKADESMMDVVHPQLHRSKAEQIEEQSYEFTKNIEKFGLRVLMGGRHKPTSTQLDAAKEQKLRDKGDYTALVDHKAAKEDEKHANSRDGVIQQGGSIEEANASEGQSAKEKRDAMVGVYAKLLQDILSDTADFFERSANALAPPKIYADDHDYARFRIAGALLPVFILTAAVPTRYFAHGGSFALGVAFFGQPLLKRAAEKFVYYVPDWQEKLDLRNSLYSGVPTEAQLALRIMRERERALNPLPRPPITATAINAKKQLNDTSLVDESKDSSVNSVGEGDESHLVGDGDHGEASTATKTKSRLAAFGKKVAKKGALFRGEGKVSVLPEDKVYEKEKKTPVSKLAAFITNRQTLKDDNDLWAYPARFKGDNGHLIIDHLEGDDIWDCHILFVPSNKDEATIKFHIEELAEIKKGGVAMSRSLLGWAAGMELGGTSLEVRVKKVGNRYHGMQVAEGVWVTNVVFEEEGDTGGGDTYQFERIGRRDQLFVRLISLAGQQWETL